MIVKTAISNSFSQAIDGYAMITTERSKIIEVEVPDPKTGEIVKHSMTKEMYLKEQGKEERAELLYAEGVRQGTPIQMRKDFERQADLNGRVSKPCIHTKISFDKIEGLSSDQLIDYSLQWMKEMGWDKTQCAIIRHYDNPKTDHVHVILNVQGYNGKLDTGWYKNRSTRAAMAVEIKNGLMIASQQTDKRKAELKETIQNRLKLSKTKEALYKQVKEKTGFEAIENRDSKGRVTGLSWYNRDKRIKYKSSAVDKNLSYSNIMGFIEERQKPMKSDNQKIDRTTEIKKLRSVLEQSIHKADSLDQLYSLVKQETGYIAKENKAANGKVSGLTWIHQHTGQELKASEVSRQLSYSKIVTAIANAQMDQLGKVSHIKKPDPLREKVEASILRQIKSGASYNDLIQGVRKETGFQVVALKDQKGKVHSLRWDHKGLGRSFNTASFSRNITLKTILGAIRSIANKHNSELEREEEQREKRKGNSRGY